jgi:D-serine deaminase-like pyridoxal phosphate-dependent protein
MLLSEAPTPAAVLDRGRLKANCERMITRARSMGVRLRPHMKTLKSAEAAKLAVDPQHGGVAASTLNEAEYWARHGYSDIQYAVCASPDKFPRIAEIMRTAPKTSFFVDGLEAAVAAVGFAREHGVPLRVWIEVDCGGRRTGVMAGDSRGLIEIARLLADPAVVFEGVATHAGQSYADHPVSAIAAVAETERAVVTGAANVLREVGIEVRGVSAGSTPTASHAASAEGLTEWRAGVYMAGDLYQAGVGSQGLDDVALSVLATVIAHDRARNQIVVDAGGLALSKDRSTSSLAERDYGYGLVCDLEGRPAFGRLCIVETHQEHGIMRSDAPVPFEALPLGARVRILPNHACMTAAAYGEYLVTDGGSEVVDRWDRTNGWS